MGKKVLVITYYFPPSGGAGVQRWLKMLRYLPENGLDPVVLAPDPAMASYPQRDESLLNDVPEGLRVETTPTFEALTLVKRALGEKALPHSGFSDSSRPSFGKRLARFARGNFFLPDARRGWNRYAFRKAAELIEREGIEAFITTSPPHSTQLVGSALKRRFPSLKWIADLRDPWTDIYYAERLYPTRLAKALNRRMEAGVVRSADAVWTTCESTRRTLALRYPEVAARLSVLTNGYDERDFAEAAPVTLPYITYIGTLTDPSDLDAFWPALRATSFRLRFAGEAAVAGRVPSDLAGRVETLPRVPHAEAVRLMRSSAVLLLVTPRVAEGGAVVPGKLFEYLAAGRPVLAIGDPSSDAAGMVVKAGAGLAAAYDDTEAMRRFLVGQEECPAASAAGIPPGVACYSRRLLAADAARRVKALLS